MLRRRTIPAVFSAVCAIALLFSSTLAFAATVRYLDLASLIEESDVIVQGRVISHEYKFDDKRNNVMTHYTVAVDRTFLGKKTKTVKFVQWGGMWQGMMSLIPGDAKFEQNEEVVLFLNEHKGVNYLTALGQSKYAVKRTASDVTVERDLTDIGFFNDGETQLPPITHKGIESISLLSFVAELESLVAAIKGGQQ